MGSASSVGKKCVLPSAAGFLWEMKPSCHRQQPFCGKKNRPAVGGGFSVGNGD
jgi:hypothetical protein